MNKLHLPLLKILDMEMVITSALSYHATKYFQGEKKRKKERKKERTSMEKVLEKNSRIRDAKKG